MEQFTKPALALTGSQHYLQVNAINAQFGADPVELPPKPAAFPELAPTALVVTNEAGAIKIALTCPGDPGDNTVIRAAKPLSAGRSKTNDFRILGTCPAPVQGSADITALYTAKFGASEPGTKVFVRLNQFVDGQESLPKTFWAIVPAAA